MVCPARHTRTSGRAAPLYSSGFVGPPVSLVTKLELGSEGEQVRHMLPKVKFTMAVGAERNGILHGIFTTIGQLFLVMNL